MALFLRIPTFLLAALIMLGCASSHPPGQRPSPGITDAYTTSFPTRDVSDELKDILRSVKRISASGIYVTYTFNDRLITREELKTVDVNEIADNTISSTASTAGTAISIFSHERRVALLTNAHVVDYPDTVITYIDRDGVEPNTFISSVKIKKEQNNLIYDLPEVGNFEIIGINQKSDLALLKVKQSQFPSLRAPALNIKSGDPRKLQWGSFVYIMGYPQGHPMVTRGIVSNPNRNDSGDFQTDALFNRGISGGLILGSRDGFRTLEWVGLTNTATATSSIHLVPDPLKAADYRPFDPYTDSIYVEEKREITYGITQSIPIQKIFRFLLSYSVELKRMGFRVNQLIDRDNESN